MFSKIAKRNAKAKEVNLKYNVTIMYKYFMNIIWFKKHQKIATFLPDLFADNLLRKYESIS